MTKRKNTFQNVEYERDVGYLTHRIGKGSDGRMLVQVRLGISISMV